MGAGSPERLVALSDGVYAIAMTLLVLSASGSGGAHVGGHGRPGRGVLLVPARRAVRGCHPAPARAIRRVRPAPAAREHR
ncbi:TMEM175 family protein [Streptomyces sp. NPDC005803]|uniref:TMEM175 family protein n=1 Tax=Streptomyces sp. NPDC005803 TaxID=3154297 RepID=UPI0033C86AD7